MHKEWEATGRFAQALEAKVIVFQCPPSFRETPENIANMRRFPWRCHRRFIALALEKQGWQVNHIIDHKRDWLPRKRSKITTS